MQKKTIYEQVKIEFVLQPHFLDQKNSFTDKIQIFPINQHFHFQSIFRANAIGDKKKEI